MFKLKDVFNGKTAVGIVLGIVAVLFDSAEILPFVLPALALDILRVVAAGFVIFGLNDAAEMNQEKLIQKIQSFLKSNPGIGFLVEILAYAVDKIDMLVLPDGVIIVVQIFGAILIVLGLKQSSVKARFNLTNPGGKFIKKYNAA